MIIDRALGVFGFPADDQSYVVAPPYFQRAISNAEFQYTIKTNDQGIRYDVIPLSKPKGEFRFVLLGDSFTEGSCVETEQRWSNLVEHQLERKNEPTIRLVNCGEGGTEPLDYGRTLYHIGLKYSPDVVLLCLYQNDIPETPADADPSDMQRQAGRSGVRKVLYTLWPNTYSRLKSTLRPNPSQRDSLKGDVVSLLRKLASKRGLTEQELQRYLDRIPPTVVAAVNEEQLGANMLTYPLSKPDRYAAAFDLDTDESRAKFSAVCRILESIGDECSNRGIRFAILLMPSVYQYDPASKNRLRAQLYGELGIPMSSAWVADRTNLEIELEAWTRDLGIPYLDLCPVFRKAVEESEEALNYQHNDHWTPAGHRIAAEAIRNWLMDEFLDGL